MSSAPTIVETARLCAQSFVRIQSIHSLDPRSESEFEDQLGRFKIWAGSLGVFAADTASADFRLKDDQDIKDVMISMITCLREQVEHLGQPSPLPTLLEEQTKDKNEPAFSGSPVSLTASSSSWELSSDSDSATNTECITDIIDRLYRLSTVIRKPASLSEHARVAQNIEKTKDNLDLEDFESYVKWQIKQWCPETTDKLIDRLSDAVVLRRQRLLYRKRHQEKLNEGTEDWFITRNPESVYLESDKPFKVQDAGLAHRPPAKMRKSVAFSATKASSVDRQAVHAYEKSVALSGITKSAIVRREKLDIPAPPKPLDELEAKCPYCSKFLVKEQLKSAQWIRHVLGDIDPYICLFEACAKPDDCFKTVDDWLNHVQWQHTLVLSCQSVGHGSELFGSRTELEQHMEREHSGEFFETQLPFLVDKSAKPSPDTFTAFARTRQAIGASRDTTNLCPLCPFSADQLDISSHSTPSVLSNPSLKDRAFKNLLDHITSHMESIALLSLPADNRLDTGVSDEFRSDSDKDIEKDDQNLPPAVFVDEPIREIRSVEGLSGEALPFDDYLMKEGWSYVLESSNVQKMTHSELKDDKTLQAFLARYRSERRKTLPDPSSTVPFCRDPDFVDRGTILAHIGEICSKPSARAALVGLGGVGKSNLAIEYSYRIREQFPHTWIFWVHASNAARFEEGYRIVAHRIRLPQRDDPMTDILRLVYDWLCDEANGRWIMILDNADDPTMFSNPHVGNSKSGVVPLSVFLPQTPNGSILVTSRSVNAALMLTGSQQNIIRVESMNEDDGLLFLRKKLGADIEKGDATELLRALDYIPLAISQAAAYINQRAPRITVAGYLDSFRENDRNRANLLNSDVGDIRRDGMASISTIATWQASCDYIRGKRPSAARLLSLMSLFDRQGIPEFLLHFHDDRGDDSDIDQKETSDIVPEDDIDIEFEEDVFALINYSLITTNVQGNQFEMRRTVQFSTRKWLELNNELEIYTKKYIRIMSEAFPTGDYENWTLCQVLFPHAKAMLAYRPAEMKYLACWAKVLDRAGGYAGSKGDYSTAEEMIRQALDGYEKALGMEHPSTLTRVSNLASVLQSQGKYEAAEEMSRHAVEGREKALGIEHPDTLMSTSNLALVLQSQGKYEQAEAIIRRALDGYEKALGKEHPETLSNVSNLASVLQSQGKYEEAEKLSRHALNGRDKVLGTEHPETLMTVRNLALVLHRQEQYTDATALYERSYAGFQKVLGLNHPSTRECYDLYSSMIEEMNASGDSGI